MKSSIRQRGSLAPPQGKHKRKVSWDPNITTEALAISNAKQITDLETPLLSGPLVILYVLVLVVMCSISLHFFLSVPTPLAKGLPNDFLAANSRRHMEDIVSLGVRHVGNNANEIHAKALILEKIEAIKSTASDRVQIEVSVQTVSGGFYLDFLGGLTHVYQNVSNIAVRLSRKSPEPSKYAFLINAHYDSALGTVAASDDAISCGTMLEVLRCLSSEPDPLLSEHSLILLFNGAEETILQASHGFVTRHPWSRQVKAFLNLEAAGAGGREIVFQTGPENPWLARLYAKVVPHPHASVVAQEIFQSGVIPSDTDFRIFRDYGGYPGIDTAYFINGYVYHTEYDVPSAIPDGSIQRAGENVLAIVREVVNSSQLATPMADDMYGKVVFFDILGLMTVVYSEDVAMAMNYGVAVVALLTFYFGIQIRKDNNSDKPSFVFVVKTLIIMKLSWVAAVVMVIIIGLLLSYLGRAMSWFANPLLILPLYVVPTILVVGEINVQWMKWNHGMPRVTLEQSSFLAAQLLFTIYLLLMTYHEICSAFICLLLVAFPLIFRSFLLEALIRPELKRGHDLSMYGVAYALCCALGAGFPMILRIQMDVGVMQLFVPLTGRMGSVVPPDLVIGVATALLVVTHSSHMLYVLIYASSAQLKRWSGVLMLLIFTTTLFLAGSGYIQPYSLSDPSLPRPKRFYLTHTDKVFHNRDGTINNTDSLVHIYPFDYLDIEPIAEVTPIFREAKVFKCEGLYCSEPSYIPIKHVAKGSWYLPAPPLDHLEPGKLILTDVTHNGSRQNFTFLAKFPKRGSMFIAPMEGHVMTEWSLEWRVPKATICPGKYETKGCYFVLMARGTGDEDFTFWIETEGDDKFTETLEIAYASHHLDPPESETPRLKELKSDLPDWVTTISWTSRYLSWIF